MIDRKPLAQNGDYALFEINTIDELIPHLACPGFESEKRLWDYRRATTEGKQYLSVLTPTYIWHGVVCRGSQTEAILWLDGSGLLHVTAREYLADGPGTPFFAALHALVGKYWRNYTPRLTGILGLPRLPADTAILDDGSLVDAATAPPHRILGANVMCRSYDIPGHLFACPLATLDVSEAPDDIFKALPLSILAHIRLGANRAYHTSPAIYVGGIEVGKGTTGDFSTLLALRHLLVSEGSRLYLRPSLSPEYVRYSGEHYGLYGFGTVTTAVIDAVDTNLSHLTKAGDLSLLGLTVSAPFLRTVNQFTLHTQRQAFFPHLEHVEDLYAPLLQTLVAPRLKGISRIHPRTAPRIHAPREAVPARYRHLLALADTTSRMWRGADLPSNEPPAPAVHLTPSKDAQGRPVVAVDGDYRLCRDVTADHLISNIARFRNAAAIDLWSAQLSGLPPDSLLLPLDQTAQDFYTLFQGETPITQLVLYSDNFLVPYMLEELHANHPHLPAICRAIAHIRASVAPLASIARLPTPANDMALLDDGTFIPLSGAPLGRILQGHFACISPPASADLLNHPLVKTDLSLAPDDILTQLPPVMLGTLVLGEHRTYHPAATLFVGALRAGVAAYGRFPELRGARAIIHDGNSGIDTPHIRSLDHFQAYDGNTGFHMVISPINKAHTVLAGAELNQFTELTTVSFLGIYSPNLCVPRLATAAIIDVPDCQHLHLPALLEVDHIFAPNLVELDVPNVNIIRRLHAPKLQTTTAPQHALPEHCSSKGIPTPPQPRFSGPGSLANILSIPNAPNSKTAA